MFNKIKLSFVIKSQNDCKCQEVVRSFSIPCRKGLDLPLKSTICSEIRRSSSLTSCMLHIQSFISGSTICVSYNSYSSIIQEEACVLQQNHGVVSFTETIRSNPSCNSRD
mmetsp:Transcript_5664/g.14145  ORF Transcript_5664/g.14145 Transcript_5664/m.14145 type:complete len:110 (+) Transcript_5664:88-417(+)